jgi:hypothetical protein
MAKERPLRRARRLPALGQRIGHYRGELMILANLGGAPFPITRGAGGFGSTGTR